MFNQKHCTSIIAFLSLLFIVLKPGNTQSTISFCDQDELFIINDADCRGGINFGDRKPDCVCISGIYRSWTEDCNLYDGFTSEYCSTLWDDNYNVHGLRLLSGVSNVYQDTVAVFGENGSDYQSWTVYGMNNNGKTWSDTFYTLNGFPVMLTKANDRFICVEPAERKEKQVCRYFANDNVGLWEPGQPVRILVQEDCGIEGYKMAELKEHKCYDIMNKNVSECRLDCQYGKITYIPGSLQARQKKSLDPDNNVESESMISPAVQNPTASGISSAVISNANFFMHRKLNKFTRLRQTGQLGIPDLSQTAPNRTFILLDMVKRIAREFCSPIFVSDLFLNSAVELFVVLHRGQDFRYIEDVPYRDFKWIEEILSNCKAERKTTRRINFGFDWRQDTNEHEECKKFNFVDTYQYSVLDYHQLVKLRRGDHHHVGKFHFVIDAVWQIIDLVHVLCYPDFGEKSYRMFHVWEQASEKLFTRDIRSLWFSPQVDMNVYNALLSDKALVDMVNLERCVEAAYAQDGLPELVRPEIQKSHFKRRKRELMGIKQPTVAKSVDVYCATENKDVSFNC